MKRQNVSARTPWEEVFGYSRAVRIGDQVKVGGTIATDENGSVYGEGDMYEQASYILQKIEGALQEVGGSLQDVVRTRMFVTNLDDWQELARAHGEVFGNIRPATTLVEISRLMSPEFLVEIEAEAILGAGSSA